MRNAAALALVVVGLSTAVLVGQALNTLTAQEKAQGWQLLFDGKSLKGWHSSVPAARGRGAAAGAPAAGASAAPAAPNPGVNQNPKPCPPARGDAPQTPAGASHWQVIDGALTACGSPTGYLTSDQSFRNFVLSLEFRAPEDTNSGVFVRAPQEAGGYEVQIWKSQPAGYNTGGIVGTAKTAREFAFKPDQWNQMQITADGDHLVVVLNGETTLDVRDAKFPDGHIRLQYQQFPIAFRNIKLRPLP
jgi:Domain of Unknown Function (DUF1080)